MQNQRNSSFKASNVEIKFIASVRKKKTVQLIIAGTQIRKKHGVTNTLIVYPFTGQIISNNAILQMSAKQRRKESLGKQN